MYTVGFGSVPVEDVAVIATELAGLDDDADDEGVPGAAEAAAAAAWACIEAAAYGSSHNPAGVSRSAPSGDHARRRKKCVELASLYSLTEPLGRAGASFEPGARTGAVAAEGGAGSAKEGFGESGGMTAGSGAGEGDRSGGLDPAPPEPVLGGKPGDMEEADDRLE